MLNLTGMPSPSTMFSAYASLSASIMLVQTTFNNLVPRQFQHYIISTIKNYLFKPESTKLIFIIEEKDSESSKNEIYDAAQLYLYSKMNSSIHSLKLTKRAGGKGIEYKFDKCDKISDIYKGIEIIWSFNCEESKKRKSDDDDDGDTQKRVFKLSFDKSERKKVMDSYIRFVIKRAKEIRNAKKIIYLFTLSPSSHSLNWDFIRLEHPTTFENLAMEKSMKQEIIEDLDKFLKRKKFYRKVGKAWKRGYLLYGPPGTGKSSLVAAMANYLKFDVFDLDLSRIKKDSDLRSLLIRTTRRSIMVIEDIDCTVPIPNRNTPSNSDDQQGEIQKPFTLSGLLNFIDGLWSSCAGERLIIFTTNHKDKLDPALLRPGRMDMHICMSYLTIDGLKVLLSTYLKIIGDDQHERIQEIEDLIRSMNVTPAEVAGELMKSDNPEVSLMGLIKFLKLKKIDDQELKHEGAAKETEVEGIPKGQKVNVDINQHDVSTEEEDGN